MQISIGARLRAKSHSTTTVASILWIPRLAPKVRWVQGYVPWDSRWYGKTYSLPTASPKMVRHDPKPRLG
jgi:hypothetical protein